jgi:hypothetical protein
LPTLVSPRKKVALKVQSSGFAAFGHPARQTSLANGTLEERDAGGLRPSPGAMRWWEAGPADAL